MELNGVSQSLSVSSSLSHPNSPSPHIFLRALWLQYQFIRLLEPFPQTDQFASQPAFKAPTFFTVLIPELYKGLGVKCRFCLNPSFTPFVKDRILFGRKFFEKWKLILKTSYHCAILLTIFFSREWQIKTKSQIYFLFLKNQMIHKLIV